VGEERKKRGGTRVTPTFIHQANVRALSEDPAMVPYLAREMKLWILEN